MSSYWLISLPAVPTPTSAWQTLRAAVGESPNEHCEVIQIRTPEFKVGTLDTLIVASEQLQKEDQVIETTVHKLVETLRNMLKEESTEDERLDAELPGLLLVGGDQKVDDFMKRFTWNSSKYRADRPLIELCERITQEVQQIETATRNRLQQYQQLKGTVQSMERKTVGNLSVRSLTDVVQREHCVMESEYLQTLFIAVPKHIESQWWNSYERLAPMVVPRSSGKIAEDNEFLLVNVTLFKKHLDEFVNRCREERFVVRDFTFQEGKADFELRELAEYKSSRLEARQQLREWLCTNFSDAFSSWVHIKIMRVFTESVLRYGLPADYLISMLVPKPKNEEKMIKKLDQKYAYLGRDFPNYSGGGGVDSAEHEESLSMLGIAGEYKAYVFFGLKWDTRSKDSRW